MSTTLIITIIMVIALVITLIILFNAYKKNKILKADNYCDKSKFVKYSAKTLRENRGMVEREYQEEINKINKEIKELEKKTDIGTYIWKTHTQGFQFGGVREDVLVEKSATKIEIDRVTYDKYKALTLEDLVEIVEQNKTNIAIYEAKMETKNKMVKEFDRIRFGKDEYERPRRSGMLI